MPGEQGEVSQPIFAEGVCVAIGSVSSTATLARLRVLGGLTLPT